MVLEHYNFILKEVCQDVKFVTILIFWLATNGNVSFQVLINISFPVFKEGQQNQNGYSKKFTFVLNVIFLNMVELLLPHYGVMLRFFWLFDIGFLNVKINGVNYVVQQTTLFYQVQEILNCIINQILYILILKFLIAFLLQIIFVSVVCQDGNSKKSKINVILYSVVTLFKELKNAMTMMKIKMMDVISVNQNTMLIVLAANLENVITEIQDIFCRKIKTTFPKAIMKQQSNIHIILLFQKNNNVQKVKLDIFKRMANLISIVAMGFKYKDLNNVMMEIQFLMMVVFIAHSNVHKIVQYVLKEYVINIVRRVLNSLINLAYPFAGMYLQQIWRNVKMLLFMQIFMSFELL
ncbi:unnamed protein product [Paramecium octaurelia]|uniref:Uncharacterized protein n=1 Tax=Paramecium octaurelia TaxID=43137 RepID=A0A8S1VS34_PAROT|nr:unnamed protein product [Paramecium octaurelia]